MGPNPSCLLKKKKVYCGACEMKGFELFWNAHLRFLSETVNIGDILFRVFFIRYFIRFYIKLKWLFSPINYDSTNSILCWWNRWCYKNTIRTKNVLTSIVIVIEICNSWSIFREGGTNFSRRKLGCILSTFHRPSQGGILGIL